MDPEKLKKYKLGGLVCKVVYDKLKNEICKNNKTNILELTQLGNQLLLEQSNEICNTYLPKNFINKISIGFPTCISLNNCNGYYVYENENQMYNTINKNDLVKIELGINIDDCINIYGDSFYNQSDDNKDNEYEVIFKVMDKLQNKITKLMKIESTNDDIKMLIESYCTKYNCFPVENTYSYQHIEQHVQTDESKYIVTNYHKYYDENDNLAVNPDICFDLEENEVYTVNLTIIPNNSDESEHIYTELHQPHIYKFNEYYHNFKLQSSKQFYGHIKKTHGNNPFHMTECKNNVKYRMGLKESLQNGILNYYPILYNKEKLPIFFKKFTVIVGKDHGINLSDLQLEEM